MLAMHVKESTEVLRQNLILNGLQGHYHVGHQTWACKRAQANERLGPACYLARQALSCDADADN